VWTGKQKVTFCKIRPRKKDKGKEKQRAAREEIEGHSDELWALSISSDGKYLATGGKDRRVGIWDVEHGAWLKGFRGHKDSISVFSLSWVVYIILIRSSGPDVSERK